jgi:phytoene dehydrogenase-like protein
MGRLSARGRGDRRWCGPVRRTAPGIPADPYSVFYPLAHGSPVLRAMELEEHGLNWAHSPTMLTHLLGPDDERAAVLYRDRERTAAGLDEHAPGYGEAWLELCRQWDVVGEPVLRSLFTAFPPVRGPLQLLHRIGTAEALRLVRFLTLPTTRMGQELFQGEPARLLLAGNAMHAVVPPTAPGSGAFGWILAMLAQQYGFPTRSAGRVSSPPRSPGEPPRRGWTFSPGTVSNGSTCGAGGRPQCTPPGG